MRQVRLTLVIRHHSVVKSCFRRSAYRASAWIVAALLPCFAVTASAQVVRCVDAAGNITYQDAPCEKGQAARNVTLPSAETRDTAGAWEAAARDGRVIKGMPKRWVIRARGTPLEIRPGSAREDATEIWRYVGRDGSLLVGFAGSDVQWIRDESARRSEPVPASPLSSSAARGPENRRFVIAGRYCEHVIAEIGPPDRQEPIALSAGEAGFRFFYEPVAGDSLMRTVFSCIGGKVADVERTVVR